jgi:hypothetical protein
MPARPSKHRPRPTGHVRHPAPVERIDLFPYRGILLEELYRQLYQRLKQADLWSDLDALLLYPYDTNDPSPIVNRGCYGHPARWPMDYHDRHLYIEPNPHGGHDVVLVLRWRAPAHSHIILRATTSGSATTARRLADLIQRVTAVEL